MTIARRLPTVAHDVPRADYVLFEGVRIPFFFEHGKGWRIRKRSLHLSVDYSTGIIAAAPARKAALEWLAKQKNGAVKLTTQTLELLVACYLAMPRRASNTTAQESITFLRAVCRTVWDRELKSIRVHEVGPKLWQEYMRIRCGGELNLATRRQEHVTINSAVRKASMIFKKTLHPAYQREGFHIPADVTQIEWLQELKRPPKALPEQDLLKAWADLPRGPLWMAVGLARFAGLRKEEINACRGSWLEKRGERWGLVVCDRPDEGFWCKTGWPRFSVILHPEVLAALQAAGAEDYVVELKGSRDQWFKGVPQAWLRAYLGERKDVSMPLHRLRGLYLDAVRASAEARLQHAAIEEARDAAGHTSSETTLKHYLSEQI